MKRAIIFHGAACKPEDFWYSWVAEQLRARGLQVEVPYYPDMNREPIATFLPKILAAHHFDEDTVLIGHSAGASLILSLLEHVKIGQAVLVAGFCTPLDDGEPDPILQDKYDWATIKQNCPDFIFINSVDDPWGCDDQQGRRMFDELGGTLIIRRDGHFGSGTNNQPYPTFPLLLKQIDV